MLLFNFYFCWLDLENNEELNTAASEASSIQGRQFTISDFTYNNSVVLGVMKKHLYSTNFTGISVSIELGKLIS